jgi:hypothetical protein
LHFKDGIASDAGQMPTFTRRHLASHSQRRGPAMATLTIIKIESGSKDDVVYDINSRIDAVKLTDLILKEVKANEDKGDWSMSIVRVLELARIATI